MRNVRGLPLEWRFWPCVLPVASGCWEWQAGKGTGYGAISAREYGTKKAHRIAYAMMKGDPTGMKVCHTCDNPPCVNPEHLFLGTQTDNMLDMHAKGRAKNPGKALTHCRAGHEYTVENTHMQGTKRKCRACGRARYFRLRAARKEVGQ